jgi:hypothetical protein
MSGKGLGEGEGGCGGLRRVVDPVTQWAAGGGGGQMAFPGVLITTASGRCEAD